jgi:hypothetical protein
MAPTTLPTLPTLSAADWQSVNAERQRVARVLREHERRASAECNTGFTGSVVCLPALALRAALNDVLNGADYPEGGEGSGSAGGKQ